MALKIVDCEATPTSITVVFSDAPNTVPAADPNFANSALNAGNFAISALLAAGPQNFNPSTLAVDSSGTVMTGTLPLVGGAPIPQGTWLTLVVSNVTLSSDPNNNARTAIAQNGIDNTIAARVNGGGGEIGRVARKATKAVEDAVSYPLLTESVSFPSSPGGGYPNGSVSPASGTTALGQTASMAISNALGWKTNSADPKGFVGALTQSFTLTEIEGHVDAKWNPRTYAVQTDLGGGITGAQASLYSRAKDALDQSMPLLNGLYPLDPEADPEDVKALREMAKSQLSEIVKELGAVGGPSVLRVDTYFQILLGQSAPIPPATTIVFDPDSIGGTLGQLRDTFGIYFQNNPYSNSIEDEQDITNFRVISDYTTSLLQSWISNKPFFNLTPGSPAFFGTQLVLISRQFSVIAETVNEVRFALQSVLIGPQEQHTLLLEFAPPLPPIFLFDFLAEIEAHVTQEGPRLIQDGGKFSVKNNIVPVVKSLLALATQAPKPTNLHKLPDGYRTVRVRRTLDDLRAQLSELLDLATPVGRDVVPPELPGSLSVFTITPATVQGPVVPGGGVPVAPPPPATAVVTVMGAGFRAGAQVSLTRQGGGVGLPPGQTTFMSSNLLAVVLTIPLAAGQGATYSVTVTNPDLSQAQGPASCVLTVN
jgi:hypothetical protein